MLPCYPSACPLRSNLPIRSAPLRRKIVAHRSVMRAAGAALVELRIEARCRVFPFIADSMPRNMGPIALQRGTIIFIGIGESSCAFY